MKVVAFLFCRVSVNLCDYKKAPDVIFMLPDEEMYLYGTFCRQTSKRVREPPTTEVAIIHKNVYLKKRSI